MKIVRSNFDGLFLVPDPRNPKRGLRGVGCLPTLQSLVRVAPVNKDFVFAIGSRKIVIGLVAFVEGF